MHVISYFTLISPLHAYNSDLGCHFAVIFMRFAIWYYLKSLTVRLFVMKKCSPITIFGIFRISVRDVKSWPCGPHFQVVYAQGSGRSKYYLNNLKQKCLREKAERFLIFD